MKRSISCLILGLTMASQSAGAQTDPNNALMKTIYTKIVDSIQLKRSALDESNNQYFFVVTQPGIFIDPALLTSDGLEDSAQKRLLSEILDRIMAPSWVYGPKDLTYHEYYKLILDSYDYKALPLPDDKKKQLAEAENRLYTGEVNEESLPKTTPAYSTYLALEKKHLEALGAAQAWLNTNPGASKYPPAEAAAIKNAMGAWLIAGKKNQIEDDLEIVRRYNPAGFWAEVRTKYEMTGGDTSLHSYYPSIKTWLDGKNQWPSLTIGWSKSESHTHNRQTSASGGGSFSLGGFFAVGGGANYDRINNVEQNEATAINIKFEYLRVDFRRPWLSRRPFSDRRWRFACGTEPEIKKSIVSSGPQPDTGGAVQYPSGEMPLIPTGFLIARNATVTGNFTQKFKEYYEQKLSGSKSVGFGPFSIRGSYNDKTEKTDVKSDIADNGFTVGHPQIIGFFTEVLPRSPDPVDGLFEPCSAPQ